MKQLFVAFTFLLFSATTTAQPFVSIGNQNWMTHNLQVTTYRNGDPIPQVTTAQLSSLTTGAWCYYNDDPATGPIYGKLYNWYAVKDPRGLAPLHWHVPSSSEWTTLTNFLGGVNVAGGKLKARGTIWNIPNVPNKVLNPDSHFEAMPAGFCGNGISVEQHASANFWTSTSVLNDIASVRILFSYTYTVSVNVEQKNFGCSVRCIADNGWPVIPGK